MQWKKRIVAFSALLVLQTQCASPAYDVVIRNGLVYDGTGSDPVRVDLALRGDSIAKVGSVHGRGMVEIDAEGRAVAPGFINVLSWAPESLIEDGRSQSDIRQGVTLEVFGEGRSMGPWNPEMKQREEERQGDIRYPVTWTTLREYLEFLEERGVSTNLASFVGATTVRTHVLGHQDRQPTSEELRKMRELVGQAMQEGALGLGSSLIYAPAFYAETEELVALAEVAGRYGGLYISHIRGEGDRLLEATDEFIAIARQARVPAEIYHLKAVGRENWKKLDTVIEKIESARAEGLQITADMYCYTAGATGLNASMPPWVQEGGMETWIERLQDPVVRAQVKKEMSSSGTDWENLFRAAGSPDKILLVGFKSAALKPMTGKTLAQVAEERKLLPEETVMDLVVEDGSRVEAVYFLMSEENIQKKLRLPWVSFCSDETSLAPEGVFLKSNPHPRAYGNFARLLSRYVRDEKVLSLQEAIRRLTSLPAGNLKLGRRGVIQKGHFADLVIFDPETIQDHATYERPHQYSTGVTDVFVNGVPVLRDGEHTGAMPGRVVRGPGWTGS